MGNKNSVTPADPSRRAFVRTSVGLTAVAGLGTLALSRAAFAAGSDSLCIGLIGCGGRNAGAAVPALNADPGTRLVAMCDLFSDRIHEKRALIREQKPAQVEVPDSRCFTGFEGYQRVIEAADVVLIANAAKFHPRHTLAAVQAGRHVFVEKPHAIDPAGIQVVRAACELANEKRLSVLSGLHSRHHAGYAETIQRIHDGAIGDVVALEENFLRAPYGVIGRKPGLSELQYQCSTQYHFHWLSGDDVVQSLVHNLDRTTWVLRGKAPVKCHGLGGRSTMTDPVYGNVFDHHAIVYEFAGGVRAYALCRTTNGCYDEDSSLVFGPIEHLDLSPDLLGRHQNKGASAPARRRTPPGHALRREPFSPGPVRRALVDAVGQPHSAAGDVTPGRPRPARQAGLRVSRIVLVSRLRRRLVLAQRLQREFLTTHTRPRRAD